MASCGAVLALALGVLAFATADVRPSERATERGMVDCLKQLDFSCMKLRALINVYNLVKTKSLRIVDGVEVNYRGDYNTEAATARAIASNNWSSLVFDYVPTLINRLSMKINMFPGAILRLSRSQKDNEIVHMSIETEDIVEGRGHKTRYILPALLFGGVYSTLITLGVIAAKFIAFKALLVGKISLVLAAVAGLAGIANQNKYQPAYTYVESVGPIVKSFADHQAYSAYHKVPEIPEPVPISAPAVPV